MGARGGREGNPPSSRTPILSRKNPLSLPFQTAATQATTMLECLLRKFEAFHVFCVSHARVLEHTHFLSREF